jgi:hypothetical protein
MITFEVLDGGTLQIAGFEAAEIRAEFYEDLPSNWHTSPKDLSDAMEECVPLAWEVQSIYDDYRESLQMDLDGLQCDGQSDNLRVASVQAELDSLPEEPEEGVRDWLLSAKEGYFVNTVIKRVEKWFNSPPDWTFESDYLADTGSAQGAAFAYFQNMDFQTLSIIGVKVIEGEHPGSTYYAAELHHSIDDANTAANASGIPVRFVKHT